MLESSPDVASNLQDFLCHPSGARGSMSSLLAMFSDINSEFYGYTIAGTTYADEFLAAAFGLTGLNALNVGNTGEIASDVDGLTFTQVMGDGWTFNDNNFWKFMLNDDLTGGEPAIRNYLRQSSSSANLFRQEVSADSTEGKMSYLAYKVINEVPEPTTLAIFALGVLGLASRRFKKN